MKKHLFVLMIFILGIVSYASGANPIIKKIEVANNREIPARTILNVMVSKEGQAFSTESVLKDYERIKALEYVQDVAIQTSVYEGGVKLTVNVQESPKTKAQLEEKGIIPMSEAGQIDRSLVVSSIVFTGSSKLSRAELLKLVPIKVGSYFSRSRVIEGHRNLMESGYFGEVIPEAYGEGNGVRSEEH
ncbi:MAG: outer membrane protein assembly factor, partial [Fusobacteriaceae bacterium]|nr:outer membrane protein assembly factor [Fusobacteriaceae bacterium]